MGFIISLDDKNIYDAIDPRTTNEFCTKEEKTPIFSADKGSSTDLENMGQDDGILLYADIVDIVANSKVNKYLNVFCEHCEIIGEGRQSAETIAIASLLEKLEYPPLGFLSTFYYRIINKGEDADILRCIMTDEVLKCDFNINLKNLLTELVAVEGLKNALKYEKNYSYESSFELRFSYLNKSLYPEFLLLLNEIIERKIELVDYCFIGYVEQRISNLLVKPFSNKVKKQIHKRYHK